MAWTQSDIDLLKGAIGAGVKNITYSDGKAVTYHSLDEMLRALAAMEADVNPGAGGQRSTYASFSRD